MSEAASLVVPIVDQEDLSVEEDMRPDEPPAAEMGEKSEKPMMEPAPEASEGGGNIEDEMVDKIGPGAE